MADTVFPLYPATPRSHNHSAESPLSNLGNSLLLSKLGDNTLKQVYLSSFPGSVAKLAN